MCAASACKMPTVHSLKLKWRKSVKTHSTCSETEVGKSVQNAHSTGSETEVEKIRENPQFFNLNITQQFVMVVTIIDFFPLFAVS